MVGVFLHTPLCHTTPKLHPVAMLLPNLLDIMHSLIANFLNMLFIIVADSRNRNDQIENMQGKLIG
jgi:hypothetical protein